MLLRMHEDVRMIGLQWRHILQEVSVTSTLRPTHVVDLSWRTAVDQLGEGWYWQHPAMACGNTWETSVLIRPCKDGSLECIGVWGP